LLEPKMKYHINEFSQVKDSVQMQDTLCSNTFLHRRKCLIGNILSFYCIIFATWNIGGAKELVVLLWWSFNIYYQQWNNELKVSACHSVFALWIKCRLAILFSLCGFHVEAASSKLVFDCIPTWCQFHQNFISSFS